MLNAECSIEHGSQVLTEFCIAMEQEAGCQMAIALQDNSAPRRFILWERYDSPAAHQQHFTEIHTREFIAAEWVSLIKVYETTVGTVGHKND